MPQQAASNLTALAAANADEVRVAKAVVRDAAAIVVAGAGKRDTLVAVRTAAILIAELPIAGLCAKRAKLRAAELPLVRKSKASSRSCLSNYFFGFFGGAQN
jgi:hypothetical protein